MKSIRIYRLDNLSRSQLNRAKAAQMEAAQVWNCCMQAHKQARLDHTKWLGEQDLRDLVKSRFALHSQSIQAIVRVFVTTIETTRQLRKTHPHMQMKYPWRTKRFYPVSWPAQAVSKEKGRIILPMGKGGNLLFCHLICQRRVGHVRWSGTMALSCMSAEKSHKRSRLLGMCRQRWTWAKFILPPSVPTPAKR